MLTAEVLRIFEQEADQLVAEYLSQVNRISGALTAGMIAERFWDFNVLMQQLEKSLSDKAHELLDVHAVPENDRRTLQSCMEQTARAACNQFNIAGKPGSG